MLHISRDTRTVKGELQCHVELAYHSMLPAFHSMGHSVRGVTGGEAEGVLLLFAARICDRCHGRDAKKRLTPIRH